MCRNLSDPPGTAVRTAYEALFSGELNLGPLFLTAEPTLSPAELPFMHLFICLFIYWPAWNSLYIRGYPQTQRCTCLCLPGAWIKVCAPGPSREVDFKGHFNLPGVVAHTYTLRRQAAAPGV